MASAIVYFQQEFPKLTETFVRAEIAELYRRSYDVKVVALKLNKKQLELCSFSDRVCQVPSGKQPEEVFQNLVRTIAETDARYLHVHWATEAKRILLPIAEQLNLPFGFTCHAADIWLRGNRLEPEELNALGNHKLCITAATIGSKHKEYLRWCGVADKKIIITPNCVDEHLLPDRRTSPPKTIQKLVAIGRPIPKKGFLVAIDAVRMLRLQGCDVTLTIIGGGDADSDLGKTITQYTNAFPFVSATGMKPYREVLDEIVQADMLLAPCMVSPDGDSDGIPTVLVEAMLLGVPVAATDVGSITDLVIPGETGFIARAGDPASLAEQIWEAGELFKDQSAATRLLEKARSQAKRHGAQFSVNVLAMHLEKCLGRFA